MPNQSNLRVSTDIDVTVSASSGVDASTVVGPSFEVKDPDGTNVTITGITTSGSGSQISAKLVTVPQKVGNHTVSVKANSLKDMSGVAVTAGTIGTFAVDYAFLRQQASGTHVTYILSGQSNMDGGFQTTLFNGAPPTKTKWWSPTEKEFVPLIPGGFGGFRNWENPVIHTAKNLERIFPSLNFYFIEYSSPGEGFRSGNGAFAPGGAAEVELTTRVRDAVGALSTTLPSFVWGGLIWNQGEAECFSSTDATNFPTQFSTLVTKLKTLTLNPLMKVHVTRISSGYNVPTSANLNAVRAQLVTMGDSWTDVDPVAPYVSQLTLPPDTDGKFRHQSAAGYALIGERYADAVRLFPVYPAAPSFNPPSVSYGTIVNPTSGDTTFTIPLILKGNSGKIVGAALPNISITLGDGTVVTGVPIAPLPTNAVSITHNYTISVPGGITGVMQGTNLPVRVLAPLSDTSGNNVPANGSIGSVNIAVNSTGDIIRPVMTLIGAPLPAAIAGSQTTVTVRVTDEISLNLATITSAAFSIKGSNNAEVFKTISISGTAQQQDIVISFKPILTGTHTIDLLANSVADTAGNYVNGGQLGTLTVNDVTIGSPINDNFLSLTSLPSHWALRNTADATLNFSASAGLTIQRVGTVVQDGRSCLISNVPWDQTRPLTVVFRGHTFRGSLGLSVDPYQWIDRAASNPKDTIGNLRNYNIYWGTADQIAGFGAAYNTGRDYRATYTKSNDDVICTIEELISSTWTLKVTATATGASPLLRNARIFVDSREGNMILKSVVN